MKPFFLSLYLKVYFVVTQQQKHSFIYQVLKPNLLFELFSFIVQKPILFKYFSIIV